jgi:hypothetical protein
MSKFVIVVNILLILLVLVVIVLGAVKWQRREGFADGFTAVEEELFTDLKNNKLSDKDIQRLISDGILTDAMVDKFLSRINVPKLVQKTTDIANKAVAKATTKTPDFTNKPPPPVAAQPAGIEKFDDRWTYF